MFIDSDPFLDRYLEQSAAVHCLDLARDGIVRSSNPAFARAAKLPASRIGDCPIWSFLAPASESALRAQMAAPHGPAAKITLEFQDSAGAPFTLYCWLLPRPSGFLLLGEAPDRSAELERAQADLKQVQSMVMHGEKMAVLGQMAAGVAHEINNPLGYVLNNHEMLAEDFGDLARFLAGAREALPQLAGRAAEANLDYLLAAIPRKLAANLEGLERVRRIVVDLKNYARLEQADFRTSDLEENVAATLRFLAPLLRAHDIKLATDFEPVGEAWFSAGALNQAVSNLVINAVQASKHGATVRVSTARDGADFLITIEDQGSGVNPEYLPRIFDPFFTTKPPGTGTGLGLSITKQVVSSHHGRIDFDTQPGQGTKVRLRIPANPPAS